MGARKRNAADAAKEARKSVSFATLKNCPTSPRKMRLVADMIRGEEVSRALSLLQFSPKEASGIRKRSNHVTLAVDKVNEENITK